MTLMLVLLALFPVLLTAAAVWLSRLPSEAADIAELQQVNVRRRARKGGAQ